MTLDEFIILQKDQAEKFRVHHIQGIRKFDWATNMTLDQWQKYFEKWQQIYIEWLKECGVK